MINILVFGDSNSWGFVDEDEGQRYDKRWPLIFADYLNQSGLSCNLHEDSLPGRTTNVNDERDGIHLNGLSVFKSCLLAHSPIDMILLMLGTNDLKKRFGREADDVAKGIEELITMSQNTFSGEGSWYSQNMSKIIIIDMLSVMGILLLFFLLFILFSSNPFDRIFPVPLNGNDLNPP